MAAGKRKFGISVEVLGVSAPHLRKLARRCGKDHRLAQQLWDTGIHEARRLAAMIDVAEQVSEQQMEDWILDVRSWDVCDGLCGDLLRKTPFAHAKAVEWSSRHEEFVRRAGYVLMAVLAIHDKQADDSIFEDYLALIKAGATDERNFVKKAVNWALRQIGKRSLRLNELARECARDVAGIDCPAARWIAADALRELQEDEIMARLQKKDLMR